MQVVESIHGDSSFRESVVRKLTTLLLFLVSLNVQANWKSFVVHIQEGTESVHRLATPGSWLDGVCRISVRKWDSRNLHYVFRDWGYALNECVTGRHENARVDAVWIGGDVDFTTHSWKSFVIHVREGEVDGEVVGGKCKGPDENGKKRTGGCARWKASPPGARLDGECWITVKKWDSTHAGIVGVWGHEFGHCVKGSWHD